MNMSMSIIDKNGKFEESLKKKSPFRGPLVHYPAREPIDFLHLDFFHQNTEVCFQHTLELTASLPLSYRTATMYGT